MWSMANVNTSKYDALSKSLKEAFSGQILPGGSSPIVQGASEKAETPAPEPPIPAIRPTTGEAQGDGQRSDAPKKEVEDLHKLKREIDLYVKEHGLEREVETSIARRGLIVRVLTDKVLFDSGSAELKKEGDALLDALARLLKTTVRNPIQVEGNTDNVPISGRFPTNWELSTTRATAVVRDLIGHGVWPGRLAATGYADRHPIATNATEAGRRMNRRVELVVLRQHAQVATEAGK
jgi:chemotaxis protein MotB